MSRLRFTRRQATESKPKKQRNFIVSALVGLLIIGVCNLFWPGFITIGFLDLWESKGTLGDWLFVAWPLFAWGVGFNVFMTAISAAYTASASSQRRMARGFLERFMPSVEPKGREVLFGGFIISLWAGVAEELAFRWLIFLSSFAGLAIANFIFGGLLGLLLFALMGLLAGLAFGGQRGDPGGKVIAGLVVGTVVGVGIYAIWGLPPGIPEWFHLNVWGPLADWTTFGKLRDHIFPATGWLAGGAMLAANAFFRDGHKYQGLIGVVNSWFIGMFLFWLAFNHGLLAAIVVHFTYDFLIFSWAALRQTWRVGF